MPRTFAYARVSKTEQNLDDKMEKKDILVITKLDSLGRNAIDINRCCQTRKIWQDTLYGIRWR